jgi:hypothetical protein
MKTARTFYTADGEGMTHKQLDGTKFTTFKTNWINIDNEVGIISKSDKQMGFGDRANNNSIMTSKLYTSYSPASRSFQNGTVVDKRNIVYYSNISAEETAKTNEQLIVLTESVPTGWNGVIAADPDGTNYLLLANFVSDQKCTIKDISCQSGAPVFTEPTLIIDGKSTATFLTEINHSVSNVLKVFINGADVTAIQVEGDPSAAYIQNLQKETVTPEVSIITSNGEVSGNIEISKGKCVKVYVEGGVLRSEEADFPSSSAENLYEGYTDITEEKITNPSFELDTTYGNDKGNVTLGSVVYNPCYTNSVSATNSKFPNILPVEGWTPGNGLSTASNFARMYSMPYSTTMFCVSPSSVGNYAAQCSRPLADDTCGVRCLTVLNSWTAGTNKITQKVNLPAGDYRLILDMKYECPNQQDNDGTSITASGNTNHSYTGIKTSSTTDYCYPKENNSWEVMVYDFTLADKEDVEISLGFNTTTGVGAANNTLLYIDNVRLLSKNTNIPDGIESVGTDMENVDVYSISGVRVKTNATRRNATQGLPKGVYIVNGKKTIVK